jgi:hypothetical protein
MIPSCLQLQTLLSQTHSGTLLEPNTRKQLPLGTKSAENPQFGNHKHCSMKTLRIREENPGAWYSNRTPTSHHSQCALSVNKIAPWDALQTHSHTHPSLHIFSPCSRRENPKAMADKGKQPIKEDSTPPKKRTIQE